jgi:ribonuclease T2
LVLLSGCWRPAWAQRPGEPGVFDYYLLSLSWSPSYCSAHGDAPSAVYQCRQGRDLGFVEHGLWPQFEDGSWPYACREGHRIPHELVAPMLESIPSEALIQHEWKVHGTCTGLAVEPYLAAARTAFKAVRQPDGAAAWLRGATIDLADLKRGFLSANPGLGADMLAILCDPRAREHVEEVRVCLDKALRFRSCGARVADNCAVRVSLDPAPRVGNNTKQP